MDDRQKKTIFFCPGPEYLFFDTSIYFLWELSHLYNIVLLLDLPFNNIRLLESLKKEKIICDFLPLSNFSQHRLPIMRGYKKHKHYSQISEICFDKYMPFAIIQHNDLEPINIYLFEEAYYRKIVRILFKASMTPPDLNIDMEFMKAIHIDSIIKRWRIPFYLANWLFNLSRFTVYCLNYCIFPFLHKRQIFRPRINLIVKNKNWYNNKFKYYDYDLTYTEEEKKALLDSAKEKADIITFPLLTVGKEVFNFFYGPTKQEDMILILPTNGEISYLMTVKNLSESDSIKFLFDKWGKAIDIISKKFPSHKIYLKPKPAKDNGRFERLISQLLDYNKKIVLFPATENTQRLILGAKVIISSTSSVLWWANFLEDKKILISLDIFDIPEGDLFSKTKGICYFDSLKTLSDFDFSQFQPEDKNIESGITLTEFMKTHVGI